MVRYNILLSVGALVAVGFGCFKFGAEFCPPTVIVPNEGATVTIAPKLARDATAEVAHDGGGQ